MKYVSATTTAVAMVMSAQLYAADEVPGPQLEEILITAQKRTEKLADVPVAAAVVSTDALAAANAGDISDLNNMVPSVNFAGTVGGRVPLGVRGISSNANQATVGLASGVAIMVDGVPIPSDSQSGNQLEDVKSIEVLKGPQATLGGRTAAAGVINVVTRGPSDHLIASLGGTLTDDHEYRFNGFIAGPLGELLRGSLSAYGNQRQYPLTNLYTGTQTQQSNAGARAKLLIKPTDALDITLTGDYHESITRGDNQVYAYLTPGANLLLGTTSTLPPAVQAPMSQAVLLAGITPSWDNQYYNSPVIDSGATIHDNNYSVEINYQLGSLSLGSTTAYQHETTVNVQDLFTVAQYFANNFRAAFAQTIGSPPGSPATWGDFFNRQTQNIDIKQLSEELKLVSSTDQPFSYVIGLFYSDTKVDLVSKRALTPASVNYDVTPITKTSDIYGRSTWKFLPTTALVTGLRFNYDQLSYTYARDASLGAATSAASSNSSALVGDISLQQWLTSSTMLYASYARGYAPKVYNTGIFSSPGTITPSLPVTGQEHINHFEIGSKGTYFEQRLTLNVAAFATVYDNYQVQTAQSIPGNPAPVLFLVPAAKAQTRGVELDSAWAATQSLRLGLNAAYIDAKFKDYTNAPCWGNAVVQTAALGCNKNPVTGQFSQDISGKPMPDSPKFKATLSAEQRIALGDSDYEAVLGGTYAYRSSAQMLPDQNPQGIQSAFGLLNLSAGINAKSGNYAVTAFVNNVGNHHYAARVEDFWSSPWNANAVSIQPARDANRYFGIRFTVSL